MFPSDTSFPRQVQQALDMLKSAVGAGAGYGEEAGIKAKASQANSAFSGATKSAASAGHRATQSIKAEL
jgi:hypothetical protein